MRLEVTPGGGRIGCGEFTWLQTLDSNKEPTPSKGTALPVELVCINGRIGKNSNLRLTGHSALRTVAVTSWLPIHDLWDSHTPVPLSI